MGVSFALKDGNDEAREVSLPEKSSFESKCSTPLRNMTAGNSRSRPSVDCVAETTHERFLKRQGRECIGKGTKASERWCFENRRREKRVIPVTCVWGRTLE